jgi:hypothetical protein
MNGPKRELMEAILAMWQKANETGENQYTRFPTTDGWILIKVRPGGIRPNVAAINSKGENLFAKIEGEPE